MATIYIDNKPHQVSDNQNLLRACLSLGFNVPYFCWHPALGSVGACRQCAVKLFRDETDTRGRIAMACMTLVSDGMRISIEDEEARKFRATVIEALMANHPHDCPVCCEGGECHLQDMTVMTGHVYRNYRFKKKTYPNQNLGPFLDHEMNRCIACYRCVRFYRDYAGGEDLNVFGAHNHVYFGRESDGILESEFSGNLVEICPTGVFTDKMHKKEHTRKWDLQSAPSICVHCGVGCNTFADERYGKLRRIHSRYNSEVNRYFLCDRGRYGYPFVNSDARIRTPLIPAAAGKAPGSGAEKWEAIAPDQALARAAQVLKGAKRILGIGSPRASLEANYALRTLVGPDNFVLGMSAWDQQFAETALKILRDGSAPAASLRDVKQSDAVFVLGEDVTQVAPLMALSLRQAAHEKPNREARDIGIPEWNDGGIRTVVQDSRGPFYIASPLPTKLDDVAAKAVRLAPAEVARLGFAVAHVIDPEAPRAAGLPEGLLNLAHEIAGQLMKAENPLLVSGPGCRNDSVLHAAANIAFALRKKGRPAKIAFTAPECNTMGLAMMGGLSLEKGLEAAASGSAEAAILLENDLYWRAERSAVDAALHGGLRLIVLDCLPNESHERASLILPAGTFAESDGTLVNYECCAQRFYQVFVPEGDIQESWRWLRDLARTAEPTNRGADWQHLDDIAQSMAEDHPLFLLAMQIAPPADYRIEGMKVPRQSHRATGRASVQANISLHEPKPPDDPDSPLAFSMEGLQGMPPAPLLARFWAPGWNSVLALTRFQEEVNGPLRGGDPGKRLIPGPGEGMAYFETMPPAQLPEPGTWTLVPIARLFGSDEMSMHCAEIASLADIAHVAIGPAAAKALEIRNGDSIRLEARAKSYRMPARIVEGVAAGVAGVFSTGAEFGPAQIPPTAILVKEP